ncbi:hypothetical protein Halru_0072 [Halovivax ruber XH-70]|uniref:Uncharacterized protein n=1 Tax=Halovivax ruber (strain DSM 18193 / JCM 13892 / XH-70) TaxID=797302 RepID=L0I7Q1_HALRX|nr:hypothetical protein [Halovivax ruber]AGB14724.1 hypothetical protein Halru_0072 [Halovivax ruber XH-70]
MTNSSEDILFHSIHEDRAGEAGGDGRASGQSDPRPGTNHDAESSRRRRTVLRDLGAIGLAAVGGLALAPSPPTRPSTVAAATDDAGAFDGAHIESEGASPIARYHYEPTDDGFASTCPINVVFPLADAEVGLDSVMAVLEAAGWTRHVEEYARYAWDPTQDAYVHQHATAAESPLGLHGRLHVRCWEFEGIVSMQAHEDTPVRPTHGITTYVGARETIEAIYDAAGWRVTPRALDLANGDAVDHDGRASLVRPPAPDRRGLHEGARERSA